MSNNDGCVIARRAEAKALAIPKWAPYFKLRDDIRRYRNHVFSSNYALYADMSNRVMTALEQMIPSVEVYSIDEAFLDLTGVRNCMVLENFGREVRETIKRNTHLNVGVGIAPTKMLAKLASHAAKKWSKTSGVLDLSNIEGQKKLMALVPVEDVWDVGRRINEEDTGLR